MVEVNFGVEVQISYVLEKIGASVDADKQARAKLHLEQAANLLASAENPDGADAPSKPSI